MTSFKDNVNITTNPRYQIGYDAEHGTIKLALHHVTPADEGLYVCRAENSEGEAITSARLVVNGGKRLGEYLAVLTCIDLFAVGKGGGGLAALSSERLSEQELLQVEMIKSGRQTIIEEVITRINETEKEVFEEKQQVLN